MKHPLRFTQTLVTLLMLGATGALAQSDSPVGEWLGKLRGTHTGTAFVAFNRDQTIAGLGYSHRNAVPFAITGNWSFNTDGAIVLQFTRTTAGISESVDAVAMARAGNRLTLKSSAFVLRARPTTDAAPLLAQATLLAANTTSNACTDQCNLQYSTCTYMALAARNSCMLRCSMMVPHNPKKCSTTCMSYWRGLVSNCDATNKVCLAACPP